MNTLSATLTSVTASEHLSLLTVLVGEDPFYLLLAQHCHDPIGTSLTLVFKETEVILFPRANPHNGEYSPSDGHKNRTRGRIVSHYPPLWGDYSLCVGTHRNVHPFGDTRGGYPLLDGTTQRNILIKRDPWNLNF